MFGKCLDKVATLECWDQTVDEGQLRVTLVKTALSVTHLFPGTSQSTDYIIYDKISDQTF